MAQRTMRVDLKVGESMRIGAATVALEEKSGQRARLRITADASVAVDPPQNNAQQAKLGVQ